MQAGVYSVNIYVYSVRVKDLKTPDRIAKAARALLEKHGAEAVSMRRVADAIGMSAMAIYRHYPNRDALLHRIADDVFAEISASWEASVKSTDIEQRLIELQDAYLDYALHHPHVFDYAYSVRRDDARRFPEDFRARRSPTLNLVADTLAAGMQKGVFRKDDIWDTAMAFWGLTHGLICLYRAGRFSFNERDFRAFYHASVRRLLDGIKV